MVHQHFMLFPPFTVLENIVIGEEAHRAGVLSTREQRARMQALMEENGITVPSTPRVEDLAVGLQQRVEILKILFRGATILIFDEPTAVLTPQESNELFRTFRALTAHGKGIIFITPQAGRGARDRGPDHRDPPGEDRADHGPRGRHQAA